MMQADYRIYPLGETALVVEFGTAISREINRKVSVLHEELQACGLKGISECIPAYADLTIFYDPYLLSVLPIDVDENSTEGLGYLKLKRIIEDIIAELDFAAAAASPLIEIPVCYGGEYGPDIAAVAEHNKLTVQDVIELHSAAEYFVYMLGFAPGFPYMGGLNPSLATPRRSSPRLSIPAGSVGIAGSQTGIYSLATPGGWQIIGRTPLRLFDAAKEQPTLLQAGSSVRFKPVSAAEYKAIEEELSCSR